MTSTPTRPLAVVAVSGGMDSATVLAHYSALGYQLFAVSVDYGQRHVRELKAARQLAEYYGVVEHITEDGSAHGKNLRKSALVNRDVAVPQGHYAAATMRATVVSGRNFWFAGILNSYAIDRDAELIALGMHAGDHAIYSDCRPEFVAAVGAAIYAGYEDPYNGYTAPRVEAPFVHRTKAQIAQYGAALGVPFDLTWSCYEGDPIHCGRCGTCVERVEAFRLAGVADPTAYADLDFALAELARKDRELTSAGSA